MKLKNIILLGGFTLLFLGCTSQSVNPASNGAITAEQLQQKSDMQLLMADDDDDENRELSFADTKGKIFYSGRSATNNNIGYRTKLLLSDLFLNAKNRLPKVSRKKRLHISVEIGKNSIRKKSVLESAQEYILHKKRYALANTDEKSMRVLGKVLKRERDSIYKRRDSIKLKNKSDIIVFLTTSKSSKSLKLKGEIISKNGEILGTAQTNINLDNNLNKEWVEVKVPRVDAEPQIFEVMRVPVTSKQYGGLEGDLSVSNISFSRANDFCRKNMKGQLLQPYVFEYARRSLAMQRPSSGKNVEIMAPYDDEDQDIYFHDGDDLEASDGSIVIFRWNDEKYFAVSNLYLSPNATFRCMRTK